jgi:hypothetical protein
MEQVRPPVIESLREPRAVVVDIHLCGYGGRLPAPELVGAFSASVRINLLVKPSHDVIRATVTIGRLGECTVVAVVEPRDLTSIKKAWCLSIAALKVDPVDGFSRALSAQ